MVGPGAATVRSEGPWASRDFNTSPMIVFYEVTRACDLVCRHCRACAQALPDPNELSGELSLRLIDQMARFPVRPMVVLTGGDPLKRGDIFELIGHAVSQGLETAITPSPTPLVTTEAITRLKAAGIHRMAVSIDGADAATHDGNARGRRQLRADPADHGGRSRSGDTPSGQHDAQPGQFRPDRGDGRSPGPASDRALVGLFHCSGGPCHGRLATFRRAVRGSLRAALHPVAASALRDQDDRSDALSPPCRPEACPDAAGRRGRPALALTLRAT